MRVARLARVAGPSVAIVASVARASVDDRRSCRAARVGGVGVARLARVAGRAVAIVASVARASVDGEGSRGANIVDKV